MACHLVGTKPLLNQCWNIVNWTLRNKTQWNLHRNSHIFNQENYFENIVCEMAAMWSWPQCLNTLRPRQNGRHFPDDIFKCIFLNENVWISNKISLKFVPKGSIGNIPALVQIMAWHRPGDKPLSELMLVSLPTHICVTRPQWVKHVTAVYCNVRPVTMIVTMIDKLGFLPAGVSQCMRQIGPNTVQPDMLSWWGWKGKFNVEIKPQGYIEILYFVVH